MTISQGSNPANLIIQDDTTNEGTQSLTGRILTVTDSEGNPFPGYTNPIDFSFASYPTNIITLSGLTADLALNVIMTLQIVTPIAGSTYSATEDIATNRYAQQGLYNIQVARFLDPIFSGMEDSNARINSMDIIIEESNSQTAVAYSSLVNGQTALTRAQNIINNQIL